MRCIKTGADVRINDRELLELAAKAAGITGEFGDKFNIGPDEVDCTDLFFIEDDSNCAVWNPLTDDGDALRLAVKLGMWVIPKDGWTDVMTKEGDLLPIERHDDPYVATRRAIVRVAAEIGRAM